MKNPKTFIIGAGFTGLGAGLTSGFKIFEASDRPGGICASYQKEGFRFEIGGGHWIFGGDKFTLDLINKFSKCKRYFRKSAVFFAGNLEETKNLRYKFVDFPIQNNLYALGNKIASLAVKEILLNHKNSQIHETITMAEWLKLNFGKTLFSIFFAPFHERYTAGLYKEIAPQDPYKTPFDIKSVLDGAFGNPNRNVGYNVSFVYPKNGLDSLAWKIAKICNIEFGSKVEKIDVETKTLLLSDGREVRYDNLISTLPLNKLLKITGISNKEEPYTSVLVLNMGVELSKSKIAKHGFHWLYIPDSLTGFHRVGYYSNVDPMFLPKKIRNPKKYGSLYVEFAFRGGQKPSYETVKKLIDNTEAELKEYGFIKKVIVVDPTWIEVAYTWKKPKSSWLEKSLNILAEKNIFSIGRYGRWNFQGIAESLKEGVFVGSVLKAKDKVYSERL
jgi:protoporphyrinogen oxidase